MDTDQRLIDYMAWQSLGFSRGWYTEDCQSAEQYAEEYWYWPKDIEAEATILR